VLLGGSCQVSIIGIPAFSAWQLGYGPTRLEVQVMMVTHRHNVCNFCRVDMIAGSSQEKEASNLRLNEIGPTGERWKQKVVAYQNSPEWAPKARRAKEKSEATGSTVAAERAKSSASTGATTEKKLPALERK
jgi:hypothetical protein